jgi:hypothetical protein
MPGVCAACLVPLAKGEKFVLMGTEVVHPGCVGGVTVMTKLRRDLIESEREKGYLQRELRAQRDHAENLGRVREIETRELAETKEAMRRRFHLEDEYRAQRDNARAERDRAFVLRDEALRQAESARREAALHPIRDAPAAPPEVDDRDPAEIRFSLLDLDPL